MSFQRGLCLPFLPDIFFYFQFSSFWEFKHLVETDLIHPFWFILYTCAYITLPGQNLLFALIALPNIKTAIIYIFDSNTCNVPNEILFSLMLNSF